MDIKEYVNTHPEKVTQIIFTLASGEPMSAEFCAIDEQDYQRKREIAIESIKKYKGQAIKSEELVKKYLFNY